VVVHYLFVRATSAALACVCLASPLATTTAHALGGSITCSLPPSLVMSAKRFGNLDADDPDASRWTRWLVVVIPHTSKRASVVMVGDGIRWTFAANGNLDCARIELGFDTHEPMSLELDVANRTGAIRSIDDRWELSWLR
jgi:hypothetical protein